jgi:hypothetical protein
MKRLAALLLTLLALLASCGMPEYVGASAGAAPVPAAVTTV